MIGKIIADTSGLTEKLGREKNGEFKELHKIEYRDDSTKWNKFQKEVKAANGDTVKIRTAIDNTELKDLRKTGGLLDYAVSQSKAGENIDLGRVNDLIQTQNYKNIANQAHGYLGVKAAIDKYNESLIRYNDDTTKVSKGTKTLNSAISQSNTNLGKYLTGLKGSKAEMGGYAVSLATAAAKTFTLKAATMAMNSILSFGISSLVLKGIELATTGFDNWIHKVTKARKRTEEIFSEFRQMNDTLADHKKTVSQLAVRYDELSKGINLSTNKNESLSTKEYEEFLNINEKLVDSFPSLAKGIDENGNFILTLGTKGMTAKEQLEELLQTEEDLNNSKIALGLKDAFKGVYTYVEDADEATEELNNVISGSNKQIGVLQNYTQNGVDLKKDNYLLFQGENTDKGKTDYVFAMQSAAQEFLEGLDDPRRIYLEQIVGGATGLFTMNTDDLTGAFDFYANLSMLEPDEITDLEQIIKNKVGTLNGALLDQLSEQKQELQEQVQKGENAWRDFIPNLVSGMKSKQTFKDLDSDLQDIAVKIVEGLDYSYADAMNAYSPDPYAYIRDKFIVPMSKLNDSDKKTLQYSFEELLSLDAYNLTQSNQAEIEKLINTIAILLEKDPLKIRAALGFDVKDIQNRYDETLAEAKRNLGGYGHDDRGFEINNDIGYTLDKFWRENVVTEEDLALWQKVTAGVDNFTKATDDFLKAKGKAMNEAGNLYAKSFKEAWHSIGTSGDEEKDRAALETKEELLELAKAGKLTEEAFSKSTIAENFLKQTKLSAREATQEINELVSSADQLSSMKTGISSISTILGEKKENLSSKKTRTKGIGVDTLAGMPEDIRKHTKEYEHFVEVLCDGTSSMDDCREAANKLATAYVNSGNFLANLTDENKDYYKSVLDEMGVENAAKIVEDTLIAKKQTHELKTEALAAATKDMGKKTSKATKEFLKHARATRLAKIELANLIAKEQFFSIDCTLSTSEKVKELNKLAKAYFGVSNAIQISSAMGADPRYWNKTENYENAVQEQWNQNVEEQTKLIVDSVNNVEVETGNRNKDKDKNKDKGKKSKSTQQFDWISRALDRLSSKLDLVKAKYDSLFTVEKIKNSDSLLKQQNKNLDKQYKLLQKTGKYQEKAQKKYTQKANSIKLDASLKKAVRQGRIKKKKESKKDLIAAYGENKAEKIQKYQDWYDKAQEQKKNIEDTKKAKKENRIQKYQNLLDNADEKKSLAQAQKENAATAAQKNEQIQKEKEYLESSYDYQIRIARLEKDSLKVTQLQAEKKKELRDLDIERHQNRADEYQGELDQYSAQKENLKTASKKNSLIESEKISTQALYNEKIAIAKLESNTTEELQLQAELKKALLDLDIEQHQNTADEYQMTLDRYSAAKSLATTVADMNSYIDNEKQITEAIYAEKTAIAHLEEKTDEELQLQYEKQKAIRDLEIEQHQNLADEHQANLDMLSAQKENMKTASDKNDVVNDEKNLTVQLYNEKIAIAQLEEKTSEQLQLQEELAKQLVQLEKEKFDNLSTYYANLRKINENQAKNLGNTLDELEARGLTATRSLYAEQKKLNDDKKRKYEEELTLLERQHDNIEKETQEWYDSLDSIQECKDQIAGCVNTAIELGNAVRNINWQIFEKMSSRLDLLSSEYELAIKLMSNKKLTSNDTGNFTKEGTATLGAYYSQLILAQKKTKESWETLADMKRHIDQGDDGYTDQKALDEYDEKYKNHIDLVGAEYDIQQNLIDLTKQKYQAELDFLQDIINKRKELLQAEKDAYDYQKTIDEKTKNIGVLSKQISALNGDESEDAKTRIQKLMVSLDEANKDLQDTEYSQWISDQQKMLDNLYNEYSDFMDDKLNDTDALLREAITYLKNPDVGQSVSESLEEYYEKYGYDPTNDFNDIQTALGETGSIATAINNAADTIIQSSENRQQNQAKADDVSKSISEIGSVYEDSKAIERYKEAKNAYDSLATGGAGGEDIRKYVSESAKAELDAKGKEADDVLNSVDEFQRYVASIGSLDDRSGYTDVNRQLLAHAYELHENLPASAKQLVGDYKYILDYKQSQYDYHGNAIREEQRIAAEQAAQEQETSNKTARDNFTNIIKSTYLKDGRTYALMSGEGVVNDELDEMLKQHGLFRSDGYSMSEAGAGAIMNQLGFSRPEQQTLSYMRDYMKRIGFSNGGIAKTLQKVPGINGDDGWVTVKKGEGILTPEQTPEFLKLVRSLDTLNPAVDIVKNLPRKALSATPGHTLNQSVGDIHIDMNFPNVTNYEDFRRQMQSDPKIEKMFKSMIWEQGDLSKYKITM